MRLAAKFAFGVFLCLAAWQTQAAEIGYLDVDWRHDPAEHRAYLERLWSFVQRLAPAHNSLKAHVLYQRLVLDRSQGVYDKPTFMAYLQLPRNANYMSRKFMELPDNRRHTADLAANFDNVTLLPAVGNDEPLVRSYLQQFFVRRGRPCCRPPSTRP